MAHFAKVRDGIVVEVLAAEPEFFNSFVDSSPGIWVQTSYNTHGGEHAAGGKPLRKNFAARVRQFESIFRHFAKTGLI